MYPHLVSIIIPVYNSEKYLTVAIKSAIDQTWENKEIILIDDGSTDGSLSIANTFAAKNVHVFSQKNMGAAAARNYGLDKAKGSFIQFLDADDLMSPNKIEAQMKRIANRQDQISFSNATHFFEDSDPFLAQPSNREISIFKSSTIPHEFLLNLYGRKGNGGIVPLHGWLIPKKLILKAGKWNETLSVDDDGEYICRVVLAASSVDFVEDVFAYYRKYHSFKSLSAQNTLKASISSFETLLLKEKHFREHANESHYQETFAASYYKLGIENYPKYKDLSHKCMEKAKFLDKNYKKKQLFLGGKTADFIANNISWKFARYIQHLKSELLH